MQQDEPSNALNAAHVRRALARANLEKATVELERRQKVADQHRERADRAKAEEQASVLEDAPRLAQACRDAEAIAAAAARELNSARATHENARKQLDVAEAAVRSAARNAARAEIRSQFTEYQSALKRLQAQRLSLLAGYLEMPDAVSDREWHELNFRSLARAEEMEIGLPILALKMDEVFAGGRPQRAIVNQHQQAWHERVAELERGEETGCDSKPIEAAA